MEFEKNFEKAHKFFVQYHLDRRSGERKGRLLRGHAHGEILFLKNVWWPMFGHFDNLHPEYEVYDFNRHSRFMDFALIAPYYKIGIEIDSFKTHIVDMDRMKHRKELNRHSFLVGLGWKMVRFAYDDVNETPEICRQLLQLIIGNYEPLRVPVNVTALIEKELIRLACSLPRPLTPMDVRKHFDADYRTAQKWINSACDHGWLVPIKEDNQQRIRKYELNTAKMKNFW
jgi:very-short-patch-repair endonuclease